MSHSILASLSPLSGVCLRLGADSASLSELQRSLGVRLPDDHHAALSESNGVQAYGGYLTIFGVGPGAALDAKVWNDPQCWKFAWGSRCSEYWCFAETAWGDQYAYNIAALRRGEAAVHFLDCLSMTPTHVASNFSEFLETEFVRSAKEPYDEMIIMARKVFGDLEVGQHLVYAPSPLLGGDENISNVRKMDARTAMICNGDIASQLDAGPKNGNVKQVAPYLDDMGRMRIKLVWT